MRETRKRQNNNCRSNCRSGFSRDAVAPDAQRKALPLLSTAGWLVNPLQQRSKNAAIVIEARTAFRPLLAGGPSGTMSFDRDALQHRG
jgi:hypothetical protein